MTPQTLQGMVLIVGIGLAVLAVAMWFDWRSARRARAALDEAPTLPGTDLPAPSYVDAEQAHRPREHCTTLTEDEQHQLDGLDGDAIEIGARLADEAFTTHADPAEMVMFNARVLCCPEGVGSVREVIGTLERSAGDQTPVILVSPTFDPEVIDLMVVNTKRGTLTAAALTASAGDCLALAAALGGSGVGRADLQSGYLPYSSYGLAAWARADDRVARFAPTPEAADQAPHATDQA